MNWGFPAYVACAPCSSIEPHGDDVKMAGTDPRVEELRRWPASPEALTLLTHGFRHPELPAQAHALVAAARVLTGADVAVLLREGALRPLLAAEPEPEPTGSELEGRDVSEAPEHLIAQLYARDPAVVRALPFDREGGQLRLILGWYRRSAPEAGSDAAPPHAAEEWVHSSRYSRALRFGQLLALRLADPHQPSLPELGSAAASALRDLFRSDRAMIARLEGDHQVVIGLDTDFPEDDVWVGDRYPTPDIAWLGLEERDYAVVEDLGDVLGVDAPPYAFRAYEAGVRSMLRARFGTPGRNLGVISLVSRTRGRWRESDGEELRLCAALFSLASVALEARAKERLRLQRLEEANEVLRLLARSEDGDVLDQALDRIRRAFGAGTLLFAWRAADGTRIARALSSDERPELLLERLQQEAVESCPASEPWGCSQALEERFQEFGYRSAARVVLEGRDGAAALLEVWSRSEDGFGESDRAALENVLASLELSLGRTRARSQLAEAEARYRALFHSAQEIAILVDPRTGTIVEANPYAHRALGYSEGELVGRPIFDLTDWPQEAIRAETREVLRTGGAFLPDRRLRRKDGATFAIDLVLSRVELGGRSAFVLMLARDVSEREAMQRQLVQTQRLEALGQMAGMVAHDFNNLLTTVLGFASLLKRARGLTAEERENVELIEEAARRGADISGRLLAFARGGLTRFARVDLREVVRDTLRLAAPAIEGRLRLTVGIPEEPVIVEGDAGQLQQALLNLLLNARDAMPDGGSVEVMLSREGSSALLVVSDDGPGMSEEVRARVFEPFFTTKGPAHGTGLGLAITYGIVQGHRGSIAVDSRPGEGATFIISLPLAPEDQESRSSDATEGDLVLVVDDDDLARRAIAATLAELGYAVVEARNGRTAIDVLRARPERISAVLLDLVMPGLTGAETFRALRAIRPDLPVIVCTGYAAARHLDAAMQREVDAILQKPITRERLQAALARVGATPQLKP